MKRFVVIFLIVALAMPACTDMVPPVSAVRKDELRKMLDAKFALTSIPKEYQEEFYRLLDAFAQGRESDEFVMSVAFSSETQATIRFSNSGMHGGGVAFMKKNGRHWVVDNKAYLM